MIPTQAAPSDSSNYKVLPYINPTQISFKNSAFETVPIKGGRKSRKNKKTKGGKSKKNNKKNKTNKRKTAKR